MDSDVRRRTELGQMLQRLRRQRDPAEIPGFVPRRGHRRRLTQADVGDLTGVSERWYRALESGAAVQFSETFLAAVGRVLGLDDGQRTTLYLLATGHEPPPSTTRDATVVDPALARVVTHQPWPTYVSNAAWDVLYCNDEALRHWPWMRHDANIMIWCLSYPEARLQLLDWEDRWARPMAAQLRLASSRYPSNTRLQAVIDEILDDNAALHRLWTAEDPRVHPDGDVRRLYLPDYREEPVTITIMACAPLRDTSMRLIMLVPQGD